VESRDALAAGGAGLLDELEGVVEGVVEGLEVALLVLLGDAKMRAAGTLEHLLELGPGSTAMSVSRRRRG
jgi:hypothetical protein